MDDCIARTARRAIDGVGDPEPPPVVPCGHCQVCTAPRPLPPVSERKARSWWPYVVAATVGFAAVWRWQR